MIAAAVAKPEACDEWRRDCSTRHCTTAFFGAPRPASETGRYFAIADIDGDGDGDILGGEASVYALVNDGGTFEQRTIGEVDEQEIMDLVAADFDADGDIDLAVARVTPSYWYIWEVAGDVIVYLNHGDGTFVPTTVASYADRGVFNLAVDDMDGDGDPDILVDVDGHDEVYDYDDERFLELLVNDAGAFDAKVPVTLGGSDWIDTPDLDGDGDPDIVLGKMVVENLGDLAFGPARALPAAGDGYTEGRGVADLDGDGDVELLDAAWFTTGGRNIGYQENLGGMTFGERTVLVEGAVGPLAIYDLDEDGDEDILALDELSPSKLRFVPNRGRLDVTSAPKLADCGEFLIGEIDGVGPVDLLCWVPGPAGANVTLVWFPGLACDIADADPSSDRGGRCGTARPDPMLPLGWAVALLACYRRSGRGRRASPRR